MLYSEFCNWYCKLLPPYLTDDAAEVINAVIGTGEHSHTQHNVTDNRAQVVKEIDRNCINIDTSTLYHKLTPQHLNCFPDS